MANEFVARKGLAIATSSISVGTDTKVLVLGDDNIVRYRTDIASSGSAVNAAGPTNSIQISAGTLGLTGFGLVDSSRGNIAFNEPGFNVTITGTNNVLMGLSASINMTSGACNTIVGAGAGSAITINSGNTFYGYCAGSSTTSDQNIFIGFRAGVANTSGCCNTYIGVEAGLNNNTLSSNTFIGYQSGQLSNTTCKSTYIGSFAGKCSKGIENIYIGHDSGVSNFTSAPSSNVFIGVASGCVNTADNNTFVGKSTGTLNTSGTQNTFLGGFAGASNSTAGLNTYIGYNSGKEVNTGSDNVAIGACSMMTANISSNNIAIGSGTLFKNSNNINLTENTAVGYCSMNLSTTAFKNVAIGSRSLQNTLTGSGNTHIGWNSGTTGNFTSTIALGACAQPTADNQLVIASSTFPVGTASSGSFTYYLNVKVNGIDFKIPLYS